jgi:hypothetical protein
MRPISIEQVTDRAGADLDFVRRLIELGALGPPDDGYGERDVHVVALLHLWERAGLSSEAEVEEGRFGPMNVVEHDDQRARGG